MQEAGASQDRPGMCRGPVRGKGGKIRDPVLHAPCKSMPQGHC